VWVKGGREIENFFVCILTERKEFENTSREVERIFLK
jgi:hypothetical protein